MKTLPYLFLLCTLFSLLSCQPKTVDHNETIEVAPLYSDLYSITKDNEDKLLIINFWATTCPPCLKEMPHFKELEKEYNTDQLKILLVSLDRSKDLESRVYPFVKKHGITPEVILLEDQNYSDWTAKVDSSWYGALPATILVKGGRKKFKFGAYESYNDLKSDVETVMHP